MSSLRSLLSLLLCSALALGLAPALPAAPQDPPKEEEETQDPPKEEGQEQEQGEEEPAEEVEEAEEEEAAEEEPSPYLAIVGGDVYTVTDGVIARGTVLIRDDKIVRVGSSVRVPEGARVLDATGMRVYPGLIAVESRGLISGRAEQLRDELDPFSRNLTLGLAGGITCTQSGDAVAKLTRGTLEGSLVAIKPWVDLNYSSTSPTSRHKLREMLDKARRHLSEKRAYDLAKQGGDENAEEPSDKGINKDHLALLRGEATARFNAQSLKDLLGICDLLSEYPMQAVVFGGQEAWACAPKLGRIDARLVLTPRNKNWADERLNRPSGWKIENARILYDAGVEFAILPQSTGISTGGIAGRDLLTLPLEAAFAIRGGLPQEAALRAITLDSAKILGVEDRVGSLEPGKDADLIVTDGDLFDYRTFVQWAVVNGRIAYDKQELSYFAHIRPRPEPTLTEIGEAIKEAIQEESEGEGEGAGASEEEALEEGE